MNIIQIAPLFRKIIQSKRIKRLFRKLFMFILKFFVFFIIIVYKYQGQIFFILVKIYEILR